MKQVEAEKIGIKGVLVESDVLAEFLLYPLSDLRFFLRFVPCFTTFVQAAELFACARNDEEKRLIEPALFGIKVLGASARYAEHIGHFLTVSEKSGSFSLRTATTLGIANASGLPILTKKFRQIYEKTLTGSTIESQEFRQRFSSYT